MLSGQIVFLLLHRVRYDGHGFSNRKLGNEKRFAYEVYCSLGEVLSSLTNLLLSFLAFLLVFIFIRAPFQWIILLIPIPVNYTFEYSLGVAMLLSFLAVFFRDLTYLMATSLYCLRI